ncbi:MAG TPA: hypothetical protein VKS01_03075 [Bryobacteraceae bacterium]|nr:hypothetical protein [Bryobacteraceae bacterium]
MPRNSSLASAPWRDARTILRATVGVLLLANLLAVGLVLFPPGGSVESLQRQLSTLSSQITRQRATLERAQQHAASVEQGKAAGDRFLNDYFLAGRTAFSTLAAELNSTAVDAKIQPREQSFNLQPIEGSDNLSYMTITAGYEGMYGDLMKFVHALDRSPRLLIIESMTAAPQQGSDRLSVSFKLDTFVRDDGTGMPPISSPDKSANQSAGAAGQ